MLRLVLHRFRVQGGLSVALGLLIAAATATSVPAETRATSHALLIGIASYAPPKGTAMPAPPPGHHSDSRFGANGTWHSLQGPPNDVAAMHVLLANTYGFTDIRELTDQDATRQGILDAINKLIGDTQQGDRVVIYYSGHGSQRLDSKSTKNQRDQTIVPVDAWKGVKDIRDKELALLFDQIVFDKKARLTAIYDSCNSGTMARGITQSVERTLPYDDDDVAAEPGAVTDVKKIPQQGDAIILAAAGPTESAVEATYPEDGMVHGAFTRALIRVLRENSQALSAEDVVSAVTSMLHADPLAFQQPSVEGRVHESLFGEPVAEHELRVQVSKVQSGTITLNMGSAGGFGAGTEFTSLEPGPDGKKTVLEVKTVSSPTASLAAVKSGSDSVHAGQMFEVSTMVYPQAARLVVYLPHPGPVPNAASLAATKALFPGLTWVDDPTTSSISFLVMQSSGGAGGSGWIAYGQNGKAIKPGPTAKGVAYLALGPLPSVVDRIRLTEPFKRQAFQFTDNPAEANYFLTMRLRADGSPEYTLFDPRVLAAHKDTDYVRSEETNDTLETEVNGGKNPEVVCRNDLSFPVRTAWLHDMRSGATEDSIAPVISRRILRLGKLRVWQQVPSIVTGANNWPYHLQIVAGEKTPSDPLHADDKYDARIVTTKDELSKRVVEKKYIYLFGFDCAANPYRLYPTDETNGVAAGPPEGADGFPTSFGIASEQIGPPFGADTLFLLATNEKIENLSLLTYDGVIESRSRGSGLDQLMVDLNDAGSRGSTPVVSQWQVQQFVVPSRP